MAFFYSSGVSVHIAQHAELSFEASCLMCWSQLSVSSTSKPRNFTEETFKIDCEAYNSLSPSADA